MLAFLDDSSRYVVAYFIYNKFEVLGRSTKHKSKIEIQLSWLNNAHSHRQC